MYCARVCHGAANENVAGAVVSSEGSTNRGNASMFTPEKLSSIQSSLVVGQQPPLLPCHVSVSTGQLTMHRVLHDLTPSYPLTSAPSTSTFTHSATLPLFCSSSTLNLLLCQCHCTCCAFSLGQFSSRYLHHWLHIFLQVSAQLFCGRDFLITMCKVETLLLP